MNSLQNRIVLVSGDTTSYVKHVPWTPKPPYSKLKHHNGRDGWRLLFEEAFCENCRKIVPLIILKWMRVWKRCSICQMKFDMEIPRISLVKKAIINSRNLPPPNRIKSARNDKNWQFGS